MQCFGHKFKVQDNVSLGLNLGENQLEIIFQSQEKDGEKHIYGRIDMPFNE